VAKVIQNGYAFKAGKRVLAFSRALIIKLRQNMRFFCHFWLKKSRRQAFSFWPFIKGIFFIFLAGCYCFATSNRGKEERFKEQTGNKNNSSITNII